MRLTKSTTKRTPLKYLSGTLELFLSITVSRYGAWWYDLKQHPPNLYMGISLAYVPHKCDFFLLASSSINYYVCALVIIQQYVNKKLSAIFVFLDAKLFYELLSPSVCSLTCSRYRHPCRLHWPSCPLRSVQSHQRCFFTGLKVNWANAHTNKWRKSIEKHKKYILYILRVKSKLIFS